MKPLAVIAVVYGLLATLAYARALQDLVSEKRESRAAWEQVQQLRSTISAGWPIKF